MRSRASLLTTFLCLSAALTIPSRLAGQSRDDHQPTYVTIDVPGAVFGTYPTGINPKGTIAGVYYDADFNGHGFLRDCDHGTHEQDCDRGGGTITTFDVIGDTFGTYPCGINPGGEITGNYCDALTCHGFLRSRAGSIITFDPPTSAGLNGTNPRAINPHRSITGFYYDASGAIHSFLRTSDGTITSFDAPGAGTGANQGTIALAINPAGEITGEYRDANFGNHGFVRSAVGDITTFDVPGADTSRGFDAYAINPAGVVVGDYFEPISGNPFGGNYRGYLRKPDGDFITFDAATYPPCCIWTFPFDINPKGTITGYLNDGHNKNRGFLRGADGAITLFDDPAAGTGDFQGTLATNINPKGAIIGYYYDANNNTHGFLRIPGDD